MKELKAHKQDLFTPGLNGSKAYRIPTLLTTDEGTVIAANDARIVDQRDNPNKINITIRRSFDNGQTWGDLQTVVEFPGDDLSSPAAIDSSLLQDEETGTIWLLYSHTPGGIGLWNSEEGVGFDENGDRLLFDWQKARYVLKDDGSVLNAKGEKTEYTVNEKGYVTKGNKTVGHIYEKFDELNQDLLYESPTTFLQVIKSEDDGETWSKPMELNTQVKEEWMRFLGTGPGIGIQLKKGEHKGRLVYPVYFSNSVRFMSCTVIYSDDNGATWKRADSPNDNRTITLESNSAKDLGVSARNHELTESQVVELSDGTLALYMRNHFGNGQIARAVSHDGGVTWENFEFVEELLNPVCQVSVINYTQESDEQDTLIFCGPRSETERENGVVLLSEDGGKTWPHAKVLESGSFVYSCLTVLENGEIGVLYETECDDEGRIKSVYASFTLDDLKA
ncbi:sialidase family protein [Alkalibacterium iburiense]